MKDSRRQVRWLLVCLWAAVWPAGAFAGGLPELLVALEAGVQPGDQFRVSEGELNRFIRNEVETSRVAAVRSIQVELMEGRFRSELTIDMDKLDLGNVSGAALFRSLLSGVQTIQLQGSVEGKDGLARYRTESASLNGVPIPASLVDMLLKQLGEKQDPPFDPTRPIPMPRGLKTLELVPGAALLAG